MVFIEELQLGGIQYRAAVCESIQLELQARQLWSPRSQKEKQTNVVDNFREIHDRRAIRRFHGLGGLIALVYWFGMCTPSR